VVPALTEPDLDSMVQLPGLLGGASAPPPPLWGHAPFLCIPCWTLLVQVLAFFSLAEPGLGSFSLGTPLLLTRPRDTGSVLSLHPLHNPRSPGSSFCLSFPTRTNMQNDMLVPGLSLVSQMCLSVYSQTCTLPAPKSTWPGSVYPRVDHMNCSLQTPHFHYPLHPSPTRVHS
jgi:hypothetical protein